MKNQVEKIFILCSPPHIRRVQNLGFQIEKSVLNEGRASHLKEDLYVATLTSLDLTCCDYDKFPELCEAYKISRGEQTIINEIRGKDRIDIEIKYDLTSLELISHSFSAIDLDLYSKLLGNPELIKSLNWRHFEKLLADILEAFGYEINLMQGTKDGGIDIIAFMRNDDFGTHKYLLQAKRWKNKVDIDVVKNVLFNHDFYKATKSCLATTATFTKGAWNLAKIYNWQLELKYYQSIQNWLYKARDIKTKQK